MILSSVSAHEDCECSLPDDTVRRLVRRSPMAPVISLRVSLLVTPPRISLVVAASQIASAASRP